MSQGQRWGTRGGAGWTLGSDCGMLSRVLRGGEGRWSPGEEDEAHGRGSC